MTNFKSILLFTTATLSIVVVLVLSGTNSLPVPLMKQADRQDHQIDNVNEVHHDINAENMPEKLSLDLLPDEDAGDRVAAVQDDSLKLQNEEKEQSMFKPPQGENGQDKELKIDPELKLSVDQLKPKDHLDVVRMEQDGHINKEYHKEMFLGEEHDEFKDNTVFDTKDRLKEIIHKADTDGDGKLSREEMIDWVQKKMKEHFQEAEEENDHIFKHLDPDGDGFVSWKEYYVHFLLSRGFDLDKSVKHVKDYDDSVVLEQDDKDALISYKFRWSDAEDDPKDNALNKKEFMLFRHPEQSQKSLDMMATNVMRGIDTNDDGVITMEEFAVLPPGEVEGEEFQEMDRKWVKEKQNEFREILDHNHDGKATLQELKNYLDPSNPIQAQLEATYLIESIDDDHDGLLSVEEIFKHSDIFVSSKIVNFAANVHDEF